LKNQNQEAQKYEVLCVDVSGACVAKTEKSLCYAILSHSDMLNEPKLANDHSIVDDKLHIKINIKHVDTDPEINDSLKSAFLIRAEGPFSSIEPMRIKLLSHLKEQNFEHLYVLMDEVSSTISNEIYPRINRVENALRKYLMKFLVTKLGPNWWNVTADAEMQKKIVSRKNNENNFSQKADGKAYLIDFGELGKIVYAQSSGFLSRDDIFSKVMSMEESAEAVKSLKIELQSNYNKFFRDTFKDKNFQQKWEELEKIRHKVAHNSLFVIEDRVVAEKLADELEAIIGEANKKIDELKFSHDERENIKDHIVSTSHAFKVITREEFLDRLGHSVKWARENSDGFLGLMSYVKTYLGNAGYDYAATFDLIRQLEEEGIVEIYEHKGLGHERSVRALRLKSDNPFFNRPFEELKHVLPTEH